MFFFQSTFPDDFIFVFHQNLRTQCWWRDVVQHRFSSLEEGKICHQSSFFLYNFYIITAEHIIQYVSVLVIYSTEYKLFLWDRTSWLRYVMFQTATWSKLESLLIKKCAFFCLISCFSCLTGNSYKNHLVSWDFFCYITETVVDFGLVG